jgi:hypothetical protein
MNTNIATTKEQSQRLLRCGVSADTADMVWTRFESDGEKYEQLSVMDESAYEVASLTPIPAWSLGALLGLLPKRIKRGDCSDYTLELSCDGCFWDLEYIYARYRGEDDSLVLFEDADPIEVCVKAIEWLTNNGYKLNKI